MLALYFYLFTFFFTKSEIEGRTGGVNGATPPSSGTTLHRLNLFSRLWFLVFTCFRIFLTVSFFVRNNALMTRT